MAYKAKSIREDRSRRNESAYSRFPISLYYSSILLFATFHFSLLSDWELGAHPFPRFDLSRAIQLAEPLVYPSPRRAHCVANGPKLALHRYSFDLWSANRVPSHMCIIDKLNLYIHFLISHHNLNFSYLHFSFLFSPFLFPFTFYHSTFFTFEIVFF